MVQQLIIMEDSEFSGGRDGSNVPYVPDPPISFGIDYEYNDFDFGVNMTYQLRVTWYCQTKVKPKYLMVMQMLETEKLMIILLFISSEVMTLWKITGYKRTE